MNLQALRLPSVHPQQVCNPEEDPVRWKSLEWLLPPVDSYLPYPHTVRQWCPEWYWSYFRWHSCGIFQVEMEDNWFPINIPKAMLCGNDDRQPDSTFILIHKIVSIIRLNQYRKVQCRHGIVDCIHLLRVFLWIYHVPDTRPNNEFGTFYTGGRVMYMVASLLLFDEAAALVIAFCPGMKNIRFVTLNCLNTFSNPDGACYIHPNNHLVFK